MLQFLEQISLKQINLQLKFSKTYGIGITNFMKIDTNILSLRYNLQYKCKLFNFITVYHTMAHLLKFKISLAPLSAVWLLVPE